MTTFSGHKDLAWARVLTAPSPKTSGTSLTLTSGAGSLMPSTLPFYATAAPNGVLPTHQNSEVVSVTNVVGDVVTFTRAQGGTTAKSISAGWQFYASLTSEWADEVEAAINAIPAGPPGPPGPGTAWAAGDKIMFVSKAGSDANDGLSPSTAKLTITAAVNAVGRGKIYVGAGIFQEQVDLTGLYQIWLVGQGANGSYNNGSIIQAPNATGSALYLSSNGGQHIVEGFTLQGYETGNVYTGHVLDYAGGQGYCTFRNLKIYGQSNDVEDGVYGGTGLFIKNTEDNSFSDITIDQCHLAMHVDSNDPGGTNSQNSFCNFFFGPNYMVFKEFDSNPGSPESGRNIYSKWKGSGAWIDSADGYAIEMHGNAHIYDTIDLDEVTGGAFPVGPTGRLSWLIDSFNSEFRMCSSASTTDVTVTGHDNVFNSFQVGGVFTIDSSAERNVVNNPTGQGGNASPGTNLVNHGIDTIIKGMQYGGWTEAGLGTKQGPPQPPVSKSGLWYATPAAPQSNVVMVANRMYLLPIWVPEISKAISIGLHVVTGAAGNAEVGIYAPAIDNIPGAYMWPVGNPTSTAGTGDITFTDWRGHLGVSGLIWLAVCCNSNPTLLGVATGSAPSPYVGDATLATMTSGAAQAFYVDSAYNGTFPYLGATVSSYVACGNVPTIFYKY